MRFATLSRQNLNFTTVSRDGHVRFYERVARTGAKPSNYYSFARSTRTILRKVAPSTTRSQFYYSFARSTRTILRKGCSGRCKIIKLLQSRAIDTHDLTKGFIGHRQDVDFTKVSRDRHVPSYEKVAFPQAFSPPWRPPPN